MVPRREVCARGKNANHDEISKYNLARIALSIEYLAAMSGGTIWVRLHCGGGRIGNCFFMEILFPAFG